jgi:nicotinamidase-related amidase
MKFALLVIDVQRAFFEEHSPAANSLAGAAEYINAAIDQFHRRQLPVVGIHHTNPDDHLVPGENGFEISEKIQILNSDTRIHKTYGNSFNKTPLHEKLQAWGVDSVILTGFAAEGCVLATYHGAKDLDLTPVILRGSLVSAHPENVAFIEKICDSISYRLLVKLLG